MEIVINGLVVKPSKRYRGYGADSLGGVYRLNKKYKLSQQRQTNRKYTRMVTRLSIDGKAYTVSVHKIVADAWLGDPPSSLHIEVNHIDGDATNNVVENLEWVTKSQNQRHAVETGLKGKGGMLYNAALTDQQVHEICFKLKDGARTIDLSKEYCTSHDIIRKIKAGDTYFHVRQLYDIDHKYKYDFSESTIVWVCERILEGLSDKGIIEISRNPNLTIIEIKRIRYKIRYKWISDKYF